MALLCYCKAAFHLQFRGRTYRIKQYYHLLQNINEYDKLKAVENWLRMRPRKKLPSSLLDWVKKQPEEEKERLSV
jgi:hypothetical protein